MRGRRAGPARSRATAMTASGSRPSNRSTEDHREAAVVVLPASLRSSAADRSSRSRLGSSPSRPNSHRHPAVVRALHRLAQVAEPAPAADRTRRGRTTTSRPIGTAHRPYAAPHRRGPAPPRRSPRRAADARRAIDHERLDRRRPRVGRADRVAAGHGGAQPDAVADRRRAVR